MVVPSRKFTLAGKIENVDFLWYFWKIRWDN